MALTATVIPGYTWATGEALTLASLNLAANPSVSIEGTIGSTSLSNGSVTEPKLGTGAVTVNKLGDDAVTAAKLKDTDSFTMAGLTILSAAPGALFSETGATNHAYLVQDNGILQAQMRLASNEATVVAIPFQMSTLAPADALVVTSAGRLGLGTASPYAAVEIKDTAPGVLLNETGATYCGALLQDAGIVMLQMRTAADLAVTHATPFKVSTDALDNSLTVAQSGGAVRVAVGTATPQAEFQVVGTIMATNYKVGSDAGVDAVIVVTGTLNGGSSGARTLTFKKGILTAAS